ncbi:MAG: NFACT family protein [Oscillospiraceae bacterium]|nr:NFACT family protein [Oscillospiraceae bacterium]
MPLDAITLTALKNELSESLSGARIDRVQQPENDTLILSVRSRDFSGRLLMCAGSGSARVHFTSARYENPAQPPMFCMLMRKHIEGARILSVRQPPMERLLDFELDAPDALGELHQKHLILELMGRYSNIILTDADMVIIGCLRNVGSASSEGRMVLPGLVYRLPEQTGKVDITLISEEEIAKALFSSEADKTADKAVVEAFMGLSPLVCREIVFRACGDTDITLAQAILRDGGRAIAGELSRLKTMLSEGGFAPHILRDDSGAGRDFSCMEIWQYGDRLRCERRESFSALLDEYYTTRDKAERARQRSQSLMKHAKTLRDRVRRKTELQKKELEKTFERETLRERADIIMANLDAVSRGATVLRAANFYAGGETVEIPLDPAKSPQQNAAKYYKDYRKAKNAGKFLAEQIENGEKELEYLESVIDELCRAETEKDISEIRRELEDAGYIQKQRQSKKEKRIERKPLRFMSSSGYDIYVGRNNTQNDELTLKTAFKGDIWLHAQKIHGSHVVIASDGKEPDDRTINEAAAIAAYFSQARDSGRVPVDYTLVKHVKKPGGAKPGMVTYREQKTVYVTPDAAIIERLKAE